MSKTPEGTREERRAVLKLAAQYLARFVAELTPLLKHVEIVVPVPANPDRYVRRMASLPDELARTTGESLALEVLRDALRWRGDLADVEMKRLSSAERRQVSAQVFMAGNQVPHVAGRSVLLVDDVTTYGSTLRACARRLLDSGATAVYACCLAHTEG
jgi:predicted amidophosphoribosyltransferase